VDGPKNRLRKINKMQDHGAFPDRFIALYNPPGSIIRGPWCKLTFVDSILFLVCDLYVYSCDIHKVFLLND